MGKKNNGWQYDGKKFARKVIHASSAFTNCLSIIFKNVAISLYVQRIFFSLSLGNQNVTKSIKYPLKKVVNCHCLKCF